MTPADLDHVFGRGRVRMVTGAHVEVFREEAAPGERRRYTKRFLCTTEGDFRHWTEREWRILARLVGHGVVAVPEVLRFERGVRGQPSMVQTYDAGVTVDHWSTLLPVRRDRRLLRHVFDDCAHWWALALHALRALDEIHALQLVHLDLKADNICIPIAPADFDPCAAGQLLWPKFEELALIDFAFSLVSGEPLAGPLPIGHQADHGYQSPRLLHALEAGRQGDLGPTRNLDWRCDMFSLAAMLRRHLPDGAHAAAGAWTHRRLEQGHALVDALFEAHHRPAGAERPHRALMDRAATVLGDAGLADSLARGWGLASEAMAPHASSLTPITRIALPVTTLAPSVADPIGAPIACSGPWLRTEPLWAPMPAAQVSLPAARAGRSAASRLVHVPRWAWLSGMVAVAAVNLMLMPPGWLEPADRGEAVAQTDELSAAMAHAQAVAEAVPASAPGTGGGSAAPGDGASSPHVGQGAPVQDDARVAAAKAPEAPKGEPLRTEPKRSALSAMAAAPLPEASTGNARRAARVAGPTPATRTLPAPPGDERRLASRSTTIMQATAPARPSLKTAPEKLPRLAAAPSPAAGREVSRPASAAPQLASARSAVSTPRVSKAEPVVISTSRVPMTLPPSAMPQPAAGTPMAAVSVGAVGTRSAAPSGVQGGSGMAEPPAVAPASGRVPADVSEAEPTVSEASVSTETVPPADAISELPEEFAERAEALIARHLPRLAQRAERLVLRVLHMASLSAVPAGPDTEVLDAASSMQRVVGDTLAVLSTAAEDARRLHAAAAAAFWSGRDPARALRLELRAFGADPRDAEVAGALAFYQLKQRPARVEAARRLALHALALPQVDSPHGRIEDWTTFAIASALAGRERDARNAWFVTLSLAPVERQCRAAVAAYAAHGAPLRASVEALLDRIRQAGRSEESPFCRWPPNWWAGAKVS